MEHQTEWLPDYLNDLNAMHEALKTQPIRIQQKYIPFLRNLCAVEGSWPEEATAAQRAKAFLRTIGKWEDDK
jgi:endonuclease YncB( thermonuclease family)